MSFPSLRALAVIGGVYDVALSTPMLLAPEFTARLFGAPPPVPVLNAQLNGLFTLTLGLGYFWCAQNVEARRGYLWVENAIGPPDRGGPFVSGRRDPYGWGGVTGCGSTVSTGGGATGVTVTWAGAPSTGGGT